MRIRYFGFLANTHRKQQLHRIRQLLDTPQPAIPGEESDDQQPDPASLADELRWRAEKEQALEQVVASLLVRNAKVFDLADKLVLDPLFGAVLADEEVAEPWRCGRFAELLRYLLAVLMHGRIRTVPPAAD